MWKCLLKTHVNDGPAEPTVHHMQLITVYLPCILSEHPDQPKSLPYSHSVRKRLRLRDHMNVLRASSDHIKMVFNVRSCASTAPSVPSCGGFFFNYPASKDPRL